MGVKIACFENFAFFLIREKMKLFNMRHFHINDLVFYLLLIIYSSELQNESILVRTLMDHI